MKKLLNTYLPALIILLILLFVRLDFCNGQTKTDSAKIQQPDSVSIRLSFKEFQDYMQTLSSAIQLSRIAKKPSEAATAIVYQMQVYEMLEEKAKPVYKQDSINKAKK